MKQINETEQYMSEREAARFVGVSRKTLRSHRRRQNVSAIVADFGRGRVVVYSVSALRAWSNIFLPRVKLYRGDYRQ